MYEIMRRMTSEVKSLKSELIKTKSEVAGHTTEIKSHDSKFEDLKNTGSFVSSPPLLLPSKNTQHSDIQTMSSEWTQNHFFHPTDTNTSDAPARVIPRHPLPSGWTANHDDEVCFSTTVFPF